MKILHLSWDFPTSKDKSVVGGMVKNPWTLANALKEKGHDVTVITTSRNNHEYKNKFSNKMENFTYVDNPRFSGGVIRNVMRMLRISKAAKGFEGDVIHAHMPSLYPILPFGKKKVRKVITAHGSHWPEMRANIHFSDLKSILILINGYIQFLLERIVYAQADQVISVSRFQIKEMRELYKLPEDKIVYIPNGINQAHFKKMPDSENEAEEFGADVLFVGRPVPKKGIDTIIRLANDERFKHLKFTLVFGTGWVSEPDISDTVKSDFDNISVVFDASEELLPAYYRNSKVTVVPSRGYESLPTVIMESLFCGTPVLASRNFGNIELLPEEMMAQEDDFDEWVEKLSKILHDGKEEALTGLNKDLLDQYDISKVAEQHLSTYSNGS